MAIVFFSPRLATAAAVRSTTQAAAATTGRVRSTRATRTARMLCTSTQTTWAGTTAIVSVDTPCDQCASSVYCLCPKLAKDKQTCNEYVRRFCDAGARSSELPSPHGKI